MEQTLTATRPLSACGLASLDTREGPLMPGFCRATSCVHGSPMWQHQAERHSFPWLSNKPWYLCVDRVLISIHLLMGVGVVAIFFGRCAAGNRPI